MTTPARIEREKLADLFLEVGPDVDTLCEGWTARDLAAHLVMRERRPDGAIGVIAKPFAGYAAKVQKGIAGREWAKLVEDVRTGPPAWSPTKLEGVEKAVNTVEFFVHHEDVLRAQTGWAVRALDTELTDDLWTALGRAAKMLTRKAPAGIVLQPDDGHTAITAKTSEPMVTIRGPVGELVLFVYGRQAHAQVELDGPADAVAALRTASFGI